jgi:N-acetylmuramoyl-L-alanine amidase
MGFISYPPEEANLASSNRQAVIVSSIVSGIERYAAAAK